MKSLIEIDCLITCSGFRLFASFTFIMPTLADFVATGEDSLLCGEVGALWGSGSSVGKWELTVFTHLALLSARHSSWHLSVSSEATRVHQQSWLWVSTVSSLKLASLASLPVGSCSAEEVEGSGVRAASDSTAVAGSLASRCRTWYYRTPIRKGLASDWQMDSGTEDSTAEVACMDSSSTYCHSRGWASC